MSFNAKDMTQGGQIASMRIRMFSQIANIMLYCLFIFFWILVGLVLWVKISWQTFVNGCIYWWCTTLEGMRDLIKSQPVYEIQYYGKTFRMNAAQVLHDKYMIWCGEQLWSAFVLATVVALVICLITFFVVSWILGRQGKQQSENEVTGGRQLTDNPKDVARMLKKDGKDSDIRIGDLPIIRDSEIQNFCLHGTVGAGKSEVIRRLANYARQRGDMVVIYDRSTDNTNTTRNDSLAARTDTWLQSFLVWSPGQRDIIKTVALVLMVLDHINLIFQLKQEWMFLAGRGAFPLFALVWGLNLSRHAHIRQPAINRLWGWGIIAQFAYYLAGFPWYEGNILFAFAVAAQVLTWCETRSGWRTAAAILLMALWGPLSGTSYGIAGLLMLAVSYRLYRAEDRAERLALLACLLAVIPALNLASSDAAAVAGLVMTVLTVGLVSCAGKSLPRFWPGDFFPVFYACHLAVLGVLAL